jgi:hypothetical protein
VKQGRTCLVLNVADVTFKAVEPTGHPALGPPCLSNSPVRSEILKRLFAILLSTERTVVAPSLQGCGPVDRVVRDVFRAFRDGKGVSLSWAIPPESMPSPREPPLVTRGETPVGGPVPRVTSRDSRTHNVLSLVWH